MYTVFPCYTVSFSAPCAVEDAAGRVAGAASAPGSDLRIAEAVYDGAQNFTLHAGTGSILYRNSYLPVTAVRVEQDGPGSSVSLRFRLRTPVKVISAVIACILLLVLIGSLWYAGVQWFPAGVLALLLLVFLLLPAFCLKRASKDISATLYRAVVRTDGEPPRLERCRRKENGKENHEAGAGRREDLLI